ncbi:MAG: DUF4405 domain-containing protein [Burkholderiales bacterium]|nr:DUF4405 domain-containing protein [Burkholderiales bacterium]
MTNTGLHKKGFASLLTTFSFTVMSISGVLLFIVPQGRIAEWTDWRMLGLTKHDWGNIHITTSLMFLLAGAYHIWCNWRTLVNYFTSKRESGLFLKKELAFSAVLTLFFVFGAVYQVPPLNSVLALNSAAKDMWIVDKDHEPPMGHAELLTMKSFAKKLYIDLDQATVVLNMNGIRFQETESLALIAKNHGMTPVRLYQLIKPLEGSVAVTVAAAPAGEIMTASLQIPVVAAAMPVSLKQAVPTQAAPGKQQVYTEELVDEYFEGRGMGRKTLAMISEENGLDLALAKKKLAARKVDMKDTDTLKEAATKAGSAPMEIMKILMVGEPVRK